MRFPLVVWRAVFAALIVLVGYLSLAPPSPDDPSGFALTRAIAMLIFDDPTRADKIGHFAAYFGLGLAIVPARIVRASLWAAPALLTAYGAMLEGVQVFLPERVADLWDLATNGLGAVVGVAVALSGRWAATRAVGPSGAAGKKRRAEL